MGAWAGLLIMAAIALFVIELFVPSHGVLGLLSLASLIAAVVCLFRIDATLGMVGLLASLIAVPAAINVALKVFPNTPVGRLLILRAEHAPAMHTVQYDKTRDADPQGLVGKEGEVVSDLRPVGMCQIDGQRVECMSVGGTLERGTRVKVTAVNGIEVRVQRA